MFVRKDQLSFIKLGDEDDWRIELRVDAAATLTRHTPGWVKLRTAECLPS